MSHLLTPPTTSLVFVLCYSLPTLWHHRSTWPPPLHPCPVTTATLCLWLESICALQEGWDWVRAPCGTLKWGMAVVDPTLSWQRHSVLSGRLSRADPDPGMSWGEMVIP